MACLQYYYENPEDAQKYAINCENKRFYSLNNVQEFNKILYAIRKKVKYLDIIFVKITNR